MKILNRIIVALGWLMWSVSCDSIEFADRFEGPIEGSIGKNVLVEDFTGQKCPNCPLAQVEIEKLQAAYGSEHVIAVALHGGALALGEGESQFVGLANEESKEYNRRMGQFAYPKGMIDRQGGLLDVEKWNAAVVSRKAMTAKVRLELDSIVVDPSTRQLSFNCVVEGRQTLEGTLQLWLTESDLVALQSLPREWGGGYREDYVHQHVFRATVNGMDGEPLVLTPNVPINQTYTFKLREDWNDENMALVMIFSNEKEGVLQVIEASLASDL